MSANGYEVVRYRPEFAEAVARLHSVHMPTGGSDASARYLTWKYETNPYIGEPLIYLALHEGEPVAMRGFFGSCWEAGESSIIVPCAADLVVHPAHQNRGLIGKIMQRAFADLRDMDYAFVFSLSGGDVAAMSARALGFKPIARMELLQRLQRLSLAFPLWQLRKVARYFANYEALRRRARGLLALSHTVLGKVHPELGHFDAAVQAGRLGEGIEGGHEPQVDAMADVIARVAQGDGIRHRRDGAYLRWRYASPARNFRFLYSRGADLDGYLALSVIQGDAVPAIRIVDWEGTTPEVKRKLLKAAILVGRFRQVSTWKFGMDESDLEILHDCGLRLQSAPAGVRGQGVTALVKALGDGAKAPTLGDKALLDPQSWNYRMIYSDLG